MAEIRREGNWALRALGYPYGVADRAVPLVQWTEAVHGRALSWLRIAEPGIATSVLRPVMVRTRDEADGLRLEADGKCLIEVGPPAVDLATCEARTDKRGCAHVVMTGVAGLHFVSAICALLVDRGLGVACTFASGGEEVAAKEFRCAGWIIALPTSNGPAFYAGDAEPDSLKLAHRLKHALFAPNTPAQQLADADLQALLAHRPTQPGRLTLSVFASGDAMKVQEKELTDLTQTATNWPHRVAHAHAHGMVVNWEDLRHLYALEERTWAPSSERSRRQAAF